MAERRHDGGGGDDDVAVEATGSERGRARTTMVTERKKNQSDEQAKKLEKHPYAMLAGGSNDEIHDPSIVVPRGKHLHFDPEDARFSYVTHDNRMHKIYYEIHGTGPKKMLCLMGLGGTHAIFEPQLEYFGLERKDEYSVCVVDNRGIGLSDTPGGRWRTTDFACDYLQLLMQLEKSSKPGEGEGWGSNVHIVAMSMGGMAALELVLMDPRRFASLVLISTHAGGLMGTIPPFHGLRPFLNTMGSLGGAGSLDAGLEILFPVDHLDKPAEVPEETHEPEVPLSTNRLRYAHAMIKRARKYVESGNAPEIRLEGVSRQVSAVLTHYVSWERLERIRSYKLGVLVISGEQDNLVGPWNSRLLSEVLCGKWLHFTDAGHGVNEQHANTVNEEIHAIVAEAEERHHREPHVVTHRKPLAPSLHPLQFFAAVVAAAWVIQRKALSRLIPSPIAKFTSLLLAAMVIRKRFGGFFAK